MQGSWTGDDTKGVDIEHHQFDVALSFPSEQREYVKCVAVQLNRLLGSDACFYDKFYEAQLARPNLDTLLHDIYGDRSGLVVVFVCAAYDAKLWCGIEWRKIRERGASHDSDIMYVRLGDGEVAGMTAFDGYLDAHMRAPEDVARLIAERVKLRRRGKINATHSSGAESLPPRPATPHIESVVPPRSDDLTIRVTVTDAMRQRFLSESFDYIVRYVENSAMALQGAHAGLVEYTTRRIDETSFEATLFEGGKQRSHCGIWFTTGRESIFGDGMYYSTKGVGNKDTFNEMLTVTNEGMEMFLCSTMDMGNWAGQIKENLSIDKAAEYLWQKLKQPLT